MEQLQSYRIAAAVPVVKPGNCRCNLEEIIRCCEKASLRGAALVLTPELSLTGAGCGDIFNSDELRNETALCVEKLKEYTRQHSMGIIAGFPLWHRGRIFNCAALFHKGAVAGICCRSSVSDSLFTSGRVLAGEKILLAGAEVPVADKILFESGELRFGVIIGEDMLLPGNFSPLLAEQGAQIIFNPSAAPELALVSRERMAFLKQCSASLTAAVVTSGAGIGEPGSDYICGGRAAVFNNGRCDAENEPLSFESSLIFADIFPRHLEMRRQRKKSRNPFSSSEKPLWVSVEPLPCSPDLEELHLEANPFIPEDKEELALRCREILAIQSAALARRVSAARAKKMVIGLSGGLDSTWAFLVCVECCRKLALPPETICAVTMPGFGTSDRTRTNAEKMAGIFGAELRVIPIADAVRGHFKDIGHDPEVRDVTYENSQARERTQILMDLANELSGIVIGTGDLSEIALGWCTYNGDQMSMYGVNGSIPKTLMRYLVTFYADNTAQGEGRAILQDVVATPVSPELLPGAQHTEELVGSYDLHDFFIWHTVQYGADSAFLQKAGEKVFKGTFTPEEIASALKIFNARFRRQQFKRNPMPDGAKAGTLSLSPRGDWNIPSDC